MYAYAHKLCTYYSVNIYWKNMHTHYVYIYAVCAYMGTYTYLYIPHLVFFNNISPPLSESVISIKRFGALSFEVESPQSDQVNRFPSVFEIAFHRTLAHIRNLA